MAMELKKKPPKAKPNAAKTANGSLGMMSERLMDELELLQLNADRLNDPKVLVNMSVGQVYQERFAHIDAKLSLILDLLLEQRDNAGAK